MSMKVSTTLTVLQFGALERLAEQHGISRSAALQLLVERHRENEASEISGLSQQALVHPTLRTKP